MTNAYIKSAAAAAALAVFNLIAVLGYSIPAKTTALISGALVMVASYFAPRIRYLGHRYAGAIGAVVGAALTFVNLGVFEVMHNETLVATFSTLIVAVGALFNPSLQRPSDS